MTKESVLGSRVASNEKKSRLRLVGEIVVFLIMFFLILRSCGKNNDLQISLNHEKDSLINKVNILTAEIDSEKALLDYCIRANALLSMENDSVVNSNKGLKLKLRNRDLKIKELENRKAIIQIADATNKDGKPGTSYLALIVSKNDDRNSNLFVLDPEPCKEKSFCRTDEFELMISETVNNTSSVINSIKGYRSLPIGNDPEVLRSCIQKDPVPYSFTVSKFKVDNELLRSSKVKNIVGTGMRLLGMIAETSLRHSKADLAVTTNGVAPYDPANQRYDANIADRKNANLKKWGEVGAWALYGGGEAFGISSRNDLSNAYSSEQVTYTLNLNWGKK